MDQAMDLLVPAAFAAGSSAPSMPTAVSDAAGAFGVTGADILRVIAGALELAALAFAFQCIRPKWRERRKFRKGLRVGRIKFAVMAVNNKGRPMWEPAAGGEPLRMTRCLRIKEYSTQAQAAQRARELSENPKFESAKVVCWDKERRRHMAWEDFDQRAKRSAARAQPQ